jgi:Fe-S cluster assembly ATPase SufC
VRWQGCVRPSKPACNAELHAVRWPHCAWMAACCRRHRVLDGVSGCFPHSTLHAIMGPSGCGKSSFLNVLSGRAHYGTPTGELFVNSELAGNMERLRHLVSTKQQGRFATGLARSVGHIAATRW